MAENQGIKFIKQNLQKLKEFFFSKDILSFLLFLLLSGILWFVNSLGKEKETTLVIPIQFQGIPQYLAITDKSTNELRVDIRDQGLRLMSYTSGTVPPVVIDLSAYLSSEKKIILNSEQLVSKIRKYVHLQSTTAILSVRPDSLVVEFEEFSQKKVPVSIKHDIDLAPQYLASSPLTADPDSIVVYAPKNLMDSIHVVDTELIKMENLSEPFSVVTKFTPIAHARFSVLSTKVSMSVEQFTEKKVLMPVTVINCPDTLSVKTFPAYVNVSFTIGLSKFNQFNTSDLTLYIDYNDLKVSVSSNQKVRVKKYKQYIGNVRVLPQDVEFILEAK